MMFDNVLGYESQFSYQLKDVFSSIPILYK